MHLEKFLQFVGTYQKADGRIESVAHFKYFHESQRVFVVFLLKYSLFAFYWREEEPIETGPRIATDVLWGDHSLIDYQYSLTFIEVLKSMEKASGTSDMPNYLDSFTSPESIEVGTHTTTFFAPSDRKLSEVLYIFYNAGICVSIKEMKAFSRAFSDSGWLYPPNVFFPVDPKVGVVQSTLTDDFGFMYVLYPQPWDCE